MKATQRRMPPYPVIHDFSITAVFFSSLDPSQITYQPGGDFSLQDFFPRFEVTIVSKPALLERFVTMQSETVRHLCPRPTTVYLISVQVVHLDADLSENTVDYALKIETVCVNERAPGWTLFVQDGYAFLHDHLGGSQFQGV